MKLEDYKFSIPEIECLKIYRDAQTDTRLQRRFLALLMVAEGIAIEAVKSILGISEYSINNWFKSYYRKGIDSLNSFQYQPKKPELSEQEEAQLKEWVKKKSPGNREMIQLHIQAQFNVFYTLSGISRLMKRLGLARIRPKTIAGKAPSLEKQTQFVMRYFQVDAFVQRDPGILQLFGDGMHLHHQLIPSLCWGDPKNPPILPTNSNRKRLNILGAYDPKQHRFVHYTSEENCDGPQVVKYFEMIKKRFPHHHTIILYLDNASYFHAPVVKAWLEEHPEFVIEHLPTYSPNLNLIERFWKFVKGKLVNNRYYEKYKTFRAKTFQLLNHTNPHLEELQSLMTEKFQLIAQF